MIYVCVPSYNEGPTIGLLLWKIRQVFTGFPREYQLIVADDGSTDATAEVLAPYTRVLPLTVIRHPERRGYAATVEALLRTAVERTDRPKRDCAILMHADFCHQAHYIPDLVRRLDSGADVVITEATITGEPSRARRLVRRWGSLVLRRAVGVPGVDDVVSGFSAFRLITLRNALRQQGKLLTTDGWTARAELIGRAARHARRVETLPTVERHDLRQRPGRVQPWELARELWRARGSLQLPPLAPAAAEPAPRRTAEAVSQ